MSIRTYVNRARVVPLLLAMLLLPGCLTIVMRDMVSGEIIQGNTSKYLYCSWRNSQTQSWRPIIAQQNTASACLGSGNPGNKRLCTSSTDHDCLPSGYIGQPPGNAGVVIRPYFKCSYAGYEIPDIWVSWDYASQTEVGGWQAPDCAALGDHTLYQLIFPAYPSPPNPKQPGIHQPCLIGSAENMSVFCPESGAGWYGVSANIEASLAAGDTRHCNPQTGEINKENIWPTSTFPTRMTAWDNDDHLLYSNAPSGYAPVLFDYRQKGILNGHAEYEVTITQDPGIALGAYNNYYQMCTVGNYRMGGAKCCGGDGRCTACIAQHQAWVAGQYPSAGSWNSPYTSFGVVASNMSSPALSSGKQSVELKQNYIDPGYTNGRQGYAGMSLNAGLRYCASSVGTPDHCTVGYTWQAGQKRPYCPSGKWECRIGQDTPSNTDNHCAFCDGGRPTWTTLDAQGNGRDQLGGSLFLNLCGNPAGSTRSCTDGQPNPNAGPAQDWNEFDCTVIGGVRGQFDGEWVVLDLCSTTISQWRAPPLSSTWREYQIDPYSIFSWLKTYHHIWNMYGCGGPAYLQYGLYPASDCRRGSNGQCLPGDVYVGGTDYTGPCTDQSVCARSCLAPSTIGHNGNTCRNGGCYQHMFNEANIGSSHYKLEMISFSIEAGNLGRQNLRVRNAMLKPR